jgi:hypothetical protein
MGGKVVIIHSKEEWDAQMSQNDAVFVIDFTATWCGPCRMIGPYFEELSGQYDTVTFLKVRLCVILCQKHVQNLQHGTTCCGSVGPPPKRLGW